MTKYKNLLNIRNQNDNLYFFSWKNTPTISYTGKLLAEVTETHLHVNVLFVPIN